MSKSSHLSLLFFICLNYRHKFLFVIFFQQIQVLNWFFVYLLLELVCFWLLCLEFTFWAWFCCFLNVFVLINKLILSLHGCNLFPSHWYILWYSLLFNFLIIIFSFDILLQVAWWVQANVLNYIRSIELMCWSVHPHVTFTIVQK